MAYKAQRSVSIAPLAVFRILFGLLMLGSTLRFASKGWISELYIDPAHHFPYFGFAWLPYPPDWAIYGLFALMGLSSLGIALGLLYRWSAGLFFLSFTYVELLDKTNYLNHYYFISLIALILIFLPSHRKASLDVKWGLVEEKDGTPQWTIDLLKIMFGGLYFMAGIAKINAAWLLDAVPMKMWLPPLSGLPLLGLLMDELWFAYLLSWAGMLYDLSIGFLLYFSLTRKWAYLSVVLFHTLTAIFFPIGMFPYIMMVCAAIFFAPSFHEGILKRIGTPVKTDGSAYAFSSLGNKWSGLLAGGMLFLLFLFPFRFLLYPEPLYWTEQGYRFSWRVMLMEKAGAAFFYVQDPSQKGKVAIDNSQYLSPQQEKMMATQPDMLLQYAQIIEKDFQQKGIADPIVTAEVFVSVNGEGSRPFIDSSVDLTQLEDNWSHKSWILPYALEDKNLAEQP